MIRIFRHYVPRSLVLLGTTEALVLFCSVYAGVRMGLMDFNPTVKLLVGGVWPKAVLYTVVVMLLMVTVGLYQRGLRDELRGLVLRVIVAFVLAVIVMTVVTGLFPGISIGRQAMTLTLVVSFIGVLGFRTLLHKYSERSVFKRRTLVLGAGRMAAQVEQLRRKSDWRDASLLGYVHTGEEDIAVDERKLLHIRTSLLQLALESEADEIVVAVEERRHKFPVSQILDCKMSGIQVVDLLGFFEQQTGKIQIDALRPSSMIFADGFIQAVLKSYVHRAFDVVVSLLMLAVTWPVMLAVCVCIWVESGFSGPILYRQVRVGRNNRNFEILKFRSMAIDAEESGAAIWAAANDDRITTVGNFIRKVRFDELPQLLNVLRGDMSFVGPRPERPEFVAELSKKIPYYDLRHRVNPGITGWAQICYPYGASDRDAKEKLQYDLYYIKNYSLFLDLMILIQTAQVILWGKGAR